MESEERGLKEVVEVLLEWTGWGGIIAAAITFLLVATPSVSLDSEAAAIILMSLLFSVTAWGTSKLIRKRGEEWKRYFGMWIAIVSLGAVLLVLAILFVPT